MSLIKDIVVGLAVDAKDFFGPMGKADQALVKFGITAKATEAQVNKVNFTGAAASVGIFAASLATAGIAAAALAALWAASKVKETIEEATAAASDFNEQLAASQVQFGPSAKIIESAAEQMGEDFGVVRTEFIKSANALGDMGLAAGMTQEKAATLATELAKLAIDAASRKNLDFAVALEKVEAGLTGEAEGMRKLGVFMNEAGIKTEAFKMKIGKAGEELTEGEKIQARFSFIAKGLSRSQGDLGDTFDSASNLVKASTGRWKNAMIDLGQAIKPLTDGFYKLRDVAFRVMAAALRENADAIKAWATDAVAAGGAVETGFYAIAKAIGVMADAWQAASQLITQGGGLGLKAMAFIQRRMGDEESAKLLEGAAQFQLNIAANKGEQPWASEVIDRNLEKARQRAVEFAKQMHAAATSEEQKAADDKVEISQKAQEKILKAQEAATQKAADDAHKVWEATRTPLEQHKTEIESLGKMFRGGMIDEQTFMRAGAASFKELHGTSMFPGAVQAGSQEAYKADIQAMFGQKLEGNEMKGILETNKKQLEVENLMLAQLKKATTAAAIPGMKLFGIGP